MSNLDSNKSTGHEIIPPKTLKSASREFSHPLADLYNRCIESCDSSLHWKKEDWVPVFKKDNKQDIKNYRPVTVLTVIGKVSEQLLNQLASFMNSKLSHNLTAYRKGQSCETSLIGLVERWKLAVDNRNVVGILSTDMSKAFDSLYPPSDASSPWKEEGGDFDIKMTVVLFLPFRGLKTVLVALRVFSL